jgi:hypothetical protein
MPRTTAPPARSRDSSGRTLTVLVAGACYAALLGVVAAPLVGTWRAERAVVTAANGPAAPVTPVARTEAARVFAVPVDDPLLATEKVYRLLADNAPAPVPASASDAPPAAAAEPAPLAAAPLPPAAPIDRAALAVEHGAEPTRPAPEAFVGVWSTHPGACAAQPSRNGYLLAAIDESGAWAGTTRCAFRDRRRTAEGWSLTAQCASPRERWTARVRLRMDGNRLHWASQRGSQTYVRCERRLITAEAG